MVHEFEACPLVQFYEERCFNRCILSVAKAGQTKFTVYRHNIFYFACGRAVIIQISNEHIIKFKVPVRVFNMKSDIGVK